MKIIKKKIVKNFNKKDSGKTMNKNKKIIKNKLENNENVKPGHNVELKKVENKIEVKKETIIDTKLSLDEEKIKDFLDIGHLYELFYFVNILKDEDLTKFIAHYKNNVIKSKDEKIDRLIRNTKNNKDLILNIKKELISVLNDDYLELRKEISVERKKGVDLYIEDINSMSIPLKIRMFSATSKKEDYYKIKKIFEDVRNNIITKKEIFEKEKVENDKFFWAMRNRDIEAEKEIEKNNRINNQNNENIKK